MAAISAMPIPTLQMEVKKDGLRQMQDGTWKLSLTVHPEDMPTALMTAPMGKIYIAALAAVGDDGEPEAPEPAKPAKTTARHWTELSRAQQAGIRCGEPRFQEWCATLRVATQTYPADPKEMAANVVRGICGVTSRADLNTTERCGQKWDALDAQYRREAGLEAEPRG